MSYDIAVTGIACRYPDARTPLELWENVLSQRRAFRSMPGERLRLEDYLSSDPGAEDTTYVGEAALIEGYEFDRVRFKVAGSTYRSADLAHWLALDVASQALEDAGFPAGEGLPHEMTGVVLGNTLTGEFSRANLMRLRWPYVRRTVEAQLAGEGWPPEQRHNFLEALERRYKDPFPPVGEETLAGGLSNTIAGRICNHFDLKGGGYTVDGACASSLLAIITACQSLASNDIDVALAGGVDLSLDPFEIVGFAKTGALAPEEMWVYDARSAGFWPGEGCGFVVLMRHETALQTGRKVYAVIRGWGVSSDGQGGITRPELEGQLLAIQRTYRRAGFGIDTVGYFEGHGTGTSVGDATELRALSRARKEAAPDVAPAAIGTIKANIGHTKAAAGVAGLIKAALALQARILPPTTGCEQPHALLTGEAPALRVLSQGEAWPEAWSEDQPLRAGVSAMGFGGINTHLVLEGAETQPRQLSSRDRTLLSSHQDAELFLFRAPDMAALRKQLEPLLAIAHRLSRAELGDLAAELERRLGGGQLRAALVAATPKALAAGIDGLLAQLHAGVTARLDTRSGLFLGGGLTSPRIAFLFPGQGSPAHLNGGLWKRRFDYVRELYGWADLPQHGDGIATQLAQPGIVTASLAALHVLDRLDVRASVAVGHSLGELTALHWGGAIGKEALLRIATARGRGMSELGSSTGAMASIGAGLDEVERLLNGDRVSVAGLNSPRQTVISGEANTVAAVVARARSVGLSSALLPVSHAFHSPLVAAAAPALAEQAAKEEFRPLQRAVISTVTGALLSPGEDLRSLLYRQVTEPVRFLDAATEAAKKADLLIEVGPGRVLAGIVPDFIDSPAVPVVALDAGGPSLQGLLQAAGAAFAMGAPINSAALFDGRFTRPFNLDWQPRFFTNPCELAPAPNDAPEARDATALASANRATGPVAPEHIAIAALEESVPTTPVSSNGSHASSAAASTLPVAVGAPTDAASPLEIVRQLVAERSELPATSVKDDSRLLSDLHLNSIAVGKLVSEAARQLGLPPPIAPNEFADATVAEVALALEELARTGGSTQHVAERVPSGVDSWVRTFTVELVDRPLRPQPQRQATNVLRKGDSEGCETNWKVLAPAGYPLADVLQHGLAACGGGVAVCLPSDPDERHLDLLLEGARAVLERRADKAGGPIRFVLVQHGGGAGAFARTLHLEAAPVTTCVIDTPENHPQTLAWVVAEVNAARAGAYVEAHYDADGARREPVLKLLEPEEAAIPTDRQYLGPGDVLLVTGGGKGIAAECALVMAEQSGVRLALMGRSQPDDDPELTANLDRLAAKGVQFKYVSADVTDRQAVLAAVREVETDLGPVTAILHGAGTNRPQLLSSLNEAAFVHTLGPKVRGARNVLEAVDPDKLKLLVSFGSIIARTGMKGEADYALANEWLARLTAEWQAEHPHCRCLAVEWSVWSGVGMGERLGRIEALAQVGVTAIPPDQGVAILQKLVARPVPSAAVVVSGRFGQAPTLKLEQPDLPFLRFLEEPQVFYPGVEIVVDATLSVGTDPYLEDHVYRGDRLLPAVMGLEAMAQAVQALTGFAGRPRFEDVEFNRPFVVSGDASLRVRIAALVREPGRVDVVLRSEETAFQVDHFRATCRVGGSEVVTAAPENNGRRANGPPAPKWATGEGYLPLDPRRHLYGSILFHKGLFQRLRGYMELRAKECIAEIGPDPRASWFARYLPAELVLGDPGMRDAVIHVIQACIPHATLLPVGIDRLVPSCTQSQGPWFVHARERSQSGDTFIYDLEVTDEEGYLVERWEGLTLRRVGAVKLPEVWAAPLLSPYLERRLGELLPQSTLSVVVQYGAGMDRKRRRDTAIRRALGAAVTIVKRPDGKPEVAGTAGGAATGTRTGGQVVSVSHSGDLSLVVTGQGHAGCDVEPVVARETSTWQALLGAERFGLARLISRDVAESEEAAATRIWAANECLKKAGAAVDAPLMLRSLSEDGWVLLSSGSLAVATFVARVEGAQEPLVMALLTCARGVEDHALV